MELTNGTIDPTEMFGNHGNMTTRPPHQPLGMVNQGSSSHDPSSDFLILTPSTSSHAVLSGRASTAPADLSHINLQVSHDTLGHDMTLEESVQKVRELVRENQDLRGNSLSSFLIKVVVWYDSC